MATRRVEFLQTHKMVRRVEVFSIGKAMIREVEIYVVTKLTREVEVTSVCRVKQ